jgi:hypothetical protein
MVLDEYYIKVSLVLLALDLMNSSQILAQSAFVAFIDTPILFVIITLIGRLLSIRNDYSMTMASAISICGSSAANAVGSTIKARKDAMFYSIAVMSLFTVPAIPLMPILYQNVLNPYLGFTDEMGGAWIGGSIDTTGAGNHLNVISIVMINTFIDINYSDCKRCDHQYYCKRYSSCSKNASKLSHWTHLPRRFVVCI